MVCKHVNEALKKIKDLGDEVRAENSSLYGKSGPYVEYETANNWINTMSRWANETTGKGVEFLKQTVIDEMGMLSPFVVKSINRNVLRERVLEIVGILNKCNCVDKDEAIAKMVKGVSGKFVKVESYEQLENELREKEEKIRSLEEKLKLYEENQGFEARQGTSEYSR